MLVIVLVVDAEKADVQCLALRLNQVLPLEIPTGKAPLAESDREQRKEN